MLKKFLAVSILSSSALFATHTNAGLIIDKVVDGEAAYSLSSVISGSYSNREVTNIDNIMGWTGANVSFDTNNTGPYSLTFTYLGESSGNSNFLFEDESGYSVVLNEDNAIGDTVTEIFNHTDEAYLPFGFSCNDRCGDGVLNGSNVIDEPNFFLGFDMTDLTTAYLFFNDGGARSDADFDDFVVSVTVEGQGINPFDLAVEVPEPSSLAILGLGVFGTGLFRRRQNKKLKK